MSGLIGISGSAGFAAGDWWETTNRQQSPLAAEAESLVSDMTSASAGTGDNASQQVIAELMDGLSSPDNTLSQLTGQQFSTANPPDVIAVTTGSDVTAQYSGGYTSPGPSWVIDDTNVNFFATGTPPNAVKGFTITFGPSATTPTQQQSVVSDAMTYLNDHGDDYQLPGGGWNQPLYDAQV